MEIEVLLSTMNIKNKQEAEALFEKMNVTGKAVMINQITQSKIEKTIEENSDKRVYSYYEKGLSKSRNKAIEKQEADIGIFADDDVVYKSDYEETIKEAYKKYNQADIIAFYVESTNEKRPVHRHSTHKVNWISAMQIQSVQITFRKNSIVKLDENFGTGGKYKCGEENIMLYDCMRLGKKIYYVNKTIGDVNHKSSTWYEGINKELLESEGAVFYRISPKLYWLLALQYAIRKRKQYKENMSIKQAISYLLEGANKYKGESKNL